MFINASIHNRDMAKKQKLSPEDAKDVVTKCTAKLAKAYHGLGIQKQPVPSYISIFFQHSEPMVEVSLDKKTKPLFSEAWSILEQSGREDAIRMGVYIALKDNSTVIESQQIFDLVGKKLSEIASGEVEEAPERSLETSPVKKGIGIIKGELSLGHELLNLVIRIEDRAINRNCEDYSLKECWEAIAYALKAYPSEFPQGILEIIQLRAQISNYSLSVPENEDISPEQHLAMKLSNILLAIGTQDAFNNCISLLDRVIRLSAQSWPFSTFTLIVNDLILVTKSDISTCVIRSSQSLHLLLETTGMPISQFSRESLQSIRRRGLSYREVDDLKEALLNMDKVLEQDVINRSRK